MNAVATRKPEHITPFQSSPVKANHSLAMARLASQRTVAEPRTEGLELSDKAIEIQASDRLQKFWTETAGPSRDAASDFRSETKVPLEGYDQTKLDNPDHKTPKYIFGRVAQNFKLDSVQGDKAKAEVLLKAMVPELQAAGLEVVDVKGDRIQVKTEVGYEWVDVVRGAGAPNPGWWWGSEGKGTPQPTNTVQEWAAQTGQTGQAAVASAPQGQMMAAGQSVGAPRQAVGGPDRGAVMAILEKNPPTNEGISQAMTELKKAFPGVKLLEHPIRLDKLEFPGGFVVDVIVGSGGPNPSWGWMPE